MLSMHPAIAASIQTLAILTLFGLIVWAVTYADQLPDGDDA